MHFQASPHANASIHHSNIINRVATRLQYDGGTEQAPAPSSNVVVRTIQAHPVTTPKSRPHQQSGTANSAQQQYRSGGQLDGMYHPTKNNFLQSDCRNTNTIVQIAQQSSSTSHINRNNVHSRAQSFKQQQIVSYLEQMAHGDFQGSPPVNNIKKKQSTQDVIRLSERDQLKAVQDPRQQLQGKPRVAASEKQSLIHRTQTRQVPGSTQSRSGKSTAMHVPPSSAMHHTTEDMNTQFPITTTHHSSILQQSAAMKYHAYHDIKNGNMPNISAGQNKQSHLAEPTIMLIENLPPSDLDQKNNSTRQLYLTQAKATAGNNSLLLPTLHSGDLHQLPNKLSQTSKAKQEVFFCGSPSVPVTILKKDQVVPANGPFLRTATSRLSDAGHQVDVGDKKKIIKQSTKQSLPTTQQLDNLYNTQPAKGAVTDLLISQSNFYRETQINSSAINQGGMVDPRNSTAIQFPLHPGSLPKNPKSKKLAGNADYARQYELYKAKQAEFYAQMQEQQIVGQVQYSPQFAPLFQLQSRMLRSPKQAARAGINLRTNAQGPLTSPKQTGQSTPASRATDSLLTLAEDSKCLQQFGAIQKSVQCPCANLGYTLRKNVRCMTARKYKEGESTRLMVAKETLKSKTRQKLPILMIMIDGVIGYWDEQKVFYIRSGVIQHIVALSTNYRVVAIAVGQTKRCVRRLMQFLAEKDKESSRQAMVFDAVYLLRKQQQRDRCNITHALLDFYDEEFELAEYCEQKVVVLSPDKVHPQSQKIESMDMRELFLIDSFHYQGRCTPLIIRMMHARLRQQNCLLFEMCFQTLVTLLTVSSTQLSTQQHGLAGTQEFKAKIVQELLPPKAKLIEKLIERSQSRTFVRSQQGEVDIMKGFGVIQVQLAQKKLDWIQIYNHDFAVPVPIVACIARITQKVLQSAVLPTGKRYNQWGLDDESIRLFISMIQANDKVNKHVRKYRAQYWANNQIDEDLCKLSTLEPEPTPHQERLYHEQLTETAKLLKQRHAALKTPQRVFQPLSDSDSEELETPTIDSELAEYDLQVPQMKYQILQLKSRFIPEGKARDKLLKFECQGKAKPLMQFCMDMLCKKQMPTVFQTTQQQHLAGGIAYQVDSEIQQLMTWIDSKPTVKGEVHTYD